MAKRRTSRGAVATGASATGAASLAATAMGAAALGAMAVGALAIGRLTVGRARLRRVEIGELAVGRLEVGARGVPGARVATCRLRAAAGAGDALERLLLDDLLGGAGYLAQRSAAEREVFLLQDDREAAPGFAALLRRAEARGLLAAPGEVEVYRTI